MEPKEYVREEDVIRIWRMLARGEITHEEGRQMINDLSEPADDER